MSSPRESNRVARVRRVIARPLGVQHLEAPFFTDYDP
jgi:hypothetical protein